jgi:hypothetical protein
MWQGISVKWDWQIAIGLKKNSGHVHYLLLIKIMVLIACVQKQLRCHAKSVASWTNRLISPAGIYNVGNGLACFQPRSREFAISP